MTIENLSPVHFVLVPLLSPGHLLPMVDIAKLLAQQGVIVSLLTTPQNTLRLKPTIDEALHLGLDIKLLQFEFPAVEAGLPEGCENMDVLPSRDLIKNFFLASSMLQKPFESIFDELRPRPSCIISGKNLAWTVETARRFKIPRLFFNGMGCFAFSCTYNLEVSNVINEKLSRFEPFTVPGLPHKIELTRARLPESLNPGSTDDLIAVRNNMVAAESVADGIIVNTFEELESDYIEEYKKIKGCKVWCIGPVSACNKSMKEKSTRGNKASVDERKCLDWLDDKPLGSVIYASLGSICGLTAKQLIELGLGLEASKRPFIWVIRGGEKSRELEKWIEEERFEERTKGRGLLIKGWSPQVMILGHPSTGAFLTHCGWNSMTEGVYAGLPLVTCPLFAEQFINEQMVIQVMKTGVSAGVEAAVAWGIEEKFGLVVKREGVKDAIEKVMDKGKEGEERRRNAKKFAEMAKKASEDGGSSFLNLKLLIKDIMQSSTYFPLAK